MAARLTPDAAGLEVHAFSGLRFNPERIRDLAAVTAPPYDVVDAAGVRRFEDLEPHNLVRLTLPRAEDCGPEGPYAHAAALLAAWRADGTLRPDDPSIYVYEQRVDGALQRGVIAAVGLSPPTAGVVLPHEDVMARAVADRTELMSVTGAQLEPILLVHDGDAAAGADIEAIVGRTASRRPVVDITTGGDRHRLWPIDDGSELRRLGRAFRRRRALIADGHHRWAAYRGVQARARAAGHGPGPWDSGLALLVDGDRYPLNLRSIHRLVAGLTLDEALAAFTARPERAAACNRVGEAARIRLDTIRSLVTAAPLASRDTLLGLVGLARTGDAAEATTLEAYKLCFPAATSGIVALRGPDRYATSPSVRAVAILHEVIAPDHWNVAEDRVSYHHDLEPVLLAARSGEGVAVLVPRPRLEDVLAVAARGLRMPRKSTSFGPKPRSGLVLRVLRGLDPNS